jgi:hypothetical protein
MVELARHVDHDARGDREGPEVARPADQGALVRQERQGADPPAHGDLASDEPVIEDVT